MGFREVFLASTRQAKIYMGKLQRAEYQNQEEFTKLLRSYIMAKFLLEEKNSEDTLSVLLDQSIQKIINLTAEEDYDTSDAPTCTGSTSKIEKKLLLLLKMKSHLKLTIGIDQLVQYDTVTRLAEKLYHLIETNS